MTGWGLVMVLAALANLAALTHWQRLNDERFVRCSKLIDRQATRVVDLVSLLEKVSLQIQSWEARRDEDCQKAAEAAKGRGL